MKIQTLYVCENCGYSTAKWMGKCPECQEWNSFIEEAVAAKTGNSKSINQHHRELTPLLNLAEIQRLPVDGSARVLSRYNDLNAVLGGGLSIGSLTLLSGEPGIGKSTLTLELCADFAAKDKSILYVSGEESAAQVAARASRMKIKAENISLLSETCLENVLAQMETSRPQIAVIDSIQVLYSIEISSMAGSIGQIRYCTEKLMEFCKSRTITCLIVGHVNKEGELAGPKVLEHLVDTVLFIEGERHHQLRLIRGMKNRFGPTNEIAVMEMTGSGLKEVKNPSELFLQGRKINSLGSAITVTLQGNRPLLLEVQALTNPTVFGYPKRTATGYDLSRLQMIAAVIQKYLRLNLTSYDIFANIIGGFKLQDTSADLSLAMAIISSQKKIPLPEKAVFLAEIGLSGELRPASQLEKRIKEAVKMGFTTIVTAKNNSQTIESKNGAKDTIKLIQAEDLARLNSLFFT